MNIIVGIFEEEEILVSAIHKIKDNGIKIKEVYTPYPVHKVIKLLERKTNLPTATFMYAAFGLIVTYLFLYYTSVISYPLIIGGKPIHSIPSFILLSFLATIFFAVLLTVLTFFLRSRLYPGKKANIVDERITDNAFVIAIESDASMSEKDITNIHALLTDNGAVEVISKPVDEPLKKNKNN